MNQEPETQTEQNAPVESTQPQIIVVGVDAERLEMLKKLYPLDWQAMDVRIQNRFVHTVSRPSNELILEREDELNQDISIDKKGAYLLPDPTEQEEIDAKFYERLEPNAKGYDGAIPENHKAAAFNGIFTSEIYVDEGCDIYGDEITVIEEIGGGDEPDFVVKHILRGASEAEVKKFRRKNNNRKIERDRRGRQKLVQSSQLRPAMEFYQSLFLRMEGAKVADAPYSDDRREEFIAQVNPLVQRAVVKAYIEELTGNLLD